MRQHCQKLRRDISGMSAVEFALTLPFIILLIFGGYELTTGINTDRRVTAVARTVADLTAQYGDTSNTNIPTTEMTSLILPAGQTVFTPYDASQLSIVVSSVRIDSNGQATIDWSTSTSNATASRRVVGAPAPISDNLKIRSTNLIWAEAWFPYTPLFGASMSGTITLRENLFMRPRQADCLKFNSVGCAPY